jgi:hypothetical protein
MNDLLLASKLCKQGSTLLLTLLAFASVASDSSWARGFGGGGFGGGRFGDRDGGEDRGADSREAGEAGGDRFGADRFNHPGARPRDDAARRGVTAHDRYDRHRLYRADWFDHHADCWRYPGMETTCWGCTSWPTFAGFWGVPVSSFPQNYDYGNNITYQYNNVYSGDQMSTASDYYDQAGKLAQSAPNISAIQAAPTPSFGESKKSPEKSLSNHQQDWKPFGVFSLLQQGETDSTKTFQLAANKDGIIRGNYFDSLTDEAKPIAGAIDKKNMRAAWTISGNQDVVYDTNKDKTDQWTLVRLKS